MRTATGTGRLIAGRYRLQDPIGRGAMGVVWRGRDELLHRDVAVKEVRLAAGAPGAGPGPGAGFERTLREARAAARLSHPGVITVFDILEEDGNPWIVMELVPGRSLDRVIAEDGPLPPRHAARLGAGLLGALAAAHAAGVLHRDVKPANVLVTAEGRAVLSDFGIAKIGADASMTQTGLVVGTPGFTAPERIRGEPATPASDLWSLGATLFAAVEGRGPYERPGGMAAICAAVVREEPPRAPSAGLLGPVIDALLRRDPAARPDAVAAAALLGEVAGDDAFSPGSGPLGSGPLSGGPLAGGALGGDGSASTIAPGGLAAAAGGVAAESTMALPPRPQAFLDPPDFAGLAMPGDPPAGWAAGAAARHGTQEYVLPVSLDPAARDRGPLPPEPYPAGRRGGGASWRILTAGAALAAIVVAAFVGLGVYSHYVTAGNAGGQPAASSPPGTSAPARAAARRPSPAPARAAAAGAALPPGYAWHTVTAGSLGSAAGFMIAAPDGWRLTRQGPSAFLAPPDGGGRIGVSVAPFSAIPLVQAQQEQAAAIANGTFPGYLPLLIAPTVFHGAPAAVWRFTWHVPGSLRAASLALLAQLPTAAGPQSYTLSVSASTADFPAFRAVFDTALKTFRPLPG